MSDHILVRGVALPTGAQITALESRADTISLEALQTERRSLIEANGHLIAMHGPYGMADHYRKRMLECMKIEARMTMEKLSIKATEGSVDAAAHASEQYGNFLDQALSDRIAFQTIANRLTEIQELVQSREVELRAFTKEIGLS